MAKLPACLNGYKHYISAAVFILMGLAGSIDPSAVNVVVEGLRQAGIVITPGMVFYVAGGVLVGLKKLDEACKA
jgi:hypothetical protein